MRTRARPEDGKASAELVLRLWQAFAARCVADDQKRTFEALATLSGVDADTIRVLVRGAEAHNLRTGPSFTTVAKISVPLGVSLDELGHIVTDRRKPKRG